MFSVCQCAGYISWYPHPGRTNLRAGVETICVLACPRMAHNSDFLALVSVGCAKKKSEFIIRGGFSFVTFLCAADKEK